MEVQDILSPTEMLLLAAMMQLGENEAYGLGIFSRAEKIGDGVKIAYGSLYPTLDRLEKRGFVSSSLSRPIPERAGRPRRLFRVEASGERAYNRTLKMMRKLPVAANAEGWNISNG